MRLSNFFSALTLTLVLTVAGQQAQAYQIDIYDYTGINFSNDLARAKSYIDSNTAIYSSDTYSVLDFNDQGDAGNIAGYEAWPITDTETFLVHVSGWFTIDTDDTYSLATYSDDGVYLTVDSSEVISNFTNHDGTLNTATIDLTSGLYYLEIYYYERTGGSQLELSYAGSDGVYSYLESSAAPVPEPATFVLFGAGMIGLGLLRNRMR